MSSLEVTIKFIALAFLLSACGSEPPKPPVGNSADATTDGNDDGGDGMDLEDEFGAAGGGDHGGDGGSDGGDDGFNEVDPGTPKTLDEMLAECGDINFDQPDAILVNKMMAGLRIVNEGNIFGIAYRVTVDPQLHIESSMLRSTSTVDFAVAATPILAQGPAEQEVAGRKGSNITEYFARDERASIFAQDSAWDGIVCTVQPASRTINQVGDGNVVTDYEPALPSTLSPAADPVRYLEEWANGPRTWQGITATVHESTNDLVPRGTKLTGSVSIRPIEPGGTVTDGEGKIHTVRADVAYELTADFGGVEVTKALGLNPVIRYYIDHSGRTFSAIQSDAKDGKTPVATFISGTP